MISAKQEGEMQQGPDLINHPPHYQGADGMEAIDVIEDWGLGFHLGNAVKYILRHRNKGGLQDLKKARWYLARVAGDPPHPGRRKAPQGIAPAFWVGQAFELPMSLQRVLDSIWRATEWPCRTWPLEELQHALKLLDEEIARLEPAVEPVEPGGSRP